MTTQVNEIQRNHSFGRLDDVPGQGEENPSETLQVFCVSQISIAIKGDDLRWKFRKRFLSTQ